MVSVMFIPSCKMKEIIINKIKKADSAKIAVAFVKDAALKELQPFLNDINKNTEVVVGASHFYITEPSALKRLLRMRNITVFYREDESFHPKLFIFCNGDKRSIIIGSSNLSKSAIGSNSVINNIEANILIEGTINDLAINDIERFFKKEILDDERINKLNERFIDEYEFKYKDIDKRRRYYFRLKLSPTDLKHIKDIKGKDLETFLKLHSRIYKSVIKGVYDSEATEIRKEFRNVKYDTISAIKAWAKKRIEEIRNNKVIERTNLMDDILSSIAEFDKIKFSKFIKENNLNDEINKMWWEQRSVLLFGEEWLN